MNKFDRYADVVKVDYFTPGALFKIRFDPDLMMMQVLSTSEHLFQCMREAFSAENESAFFIKAHGYSIDSKVYLINKFGYFKFSDGFEHLVVQLSCFIGKSRFGIFDTYEEKICVMLRGNQSLVFKKCFVM